MIVKPAPGLRVRDPRNMQHIPEEGISVPDGDPFWMRRLADKDVLLVSQIPDSKQPAAPKSEK